MTLIPISRSSLHKCIGNEYHCGPWHGDRWTSQNDSVQQNFHRCSLTQAWLQTSHHSSGKATEYPALVKSTRQSSIQFSYDPFYMFVVLTNKHLSTNTKHYPSNGKTLTMKFITKFVICQCALLIPFSLLIITLFTHKHSHKMAPTKK